MRDSTVVDKSENWDVSVYTLTIEIVVKHLCQALDCCSMIYYGSCLNIFKSLDGGGIDTVPIVRPTYVGRRMLQPEHEWIPQANR